jgi:hypothetical protein
MEPSRLHFEGKEFSCEEHLHGCLLSWKRSAADWSRTPLITKTEKNSFKLGTVVFLKTAG